MLTHVPLLGYNVLISGANASLKCYDKPVYQCNYGFTHIISNKTSLTNFTSQSRAICIHCGKNKGISRYKDFIHELYLMKFVTNYSCYDCFVEVGVYSFALWLCFQFSDWVGIVRFTTFTFHLIITYVIMRWKVNAVNGLFLSNLKIVNKATIDSKVADWTCNLKI